MPNKFDTERKAKLNATQWAYLHTAAIAKSNPVDGSPPEYFWFYSEDLVPAHLEIVSIGKGGKWKRVDKEAE